MCGGHHEHRGHGRRFGRRGFPSRDVWVDRLQAYQAHLEQELENVRDVIERLGPEAPGQPETETV
jgi:ribosomal protein L19E